MKKIRNIVIIVLAVAALSFKLFYNKKQIEKNSRMAENQLMAVPVYSSQAKMMKISLNFDESGKFTASHELTLLSEGQGRVIQILVNTGDNVREGQLIARLDDELAKSQYSLAELNYNKLSSDLVKYLELQKGNAMTSMQVEDAKIAVANAKTSLAMAKKQLDNTIVKAPIAGTITRLYIEKGTLLSPGAMVVDIVDINLLKFNTSISESGLSRVFTGQKVKITSDVQSDEKYDGKVRFISVKANEAGKYELEIEVANKTNKTVRAGMFGRAWFEYDQAVELLVIPRKCIVGSFKDPMVYMIRDGVAKFISVKTGIITDDYVEILNGLNNGDLVVLSGQINLHDGSKVVLKQNGK